MTQTEGILAWLKDGKSITALDALEQFQCFRLAARIADIRAQGYTVHTDMVKTRTGKKVASYSLGESTYSMLLTLRNQKLRERKEGEKKNAAIN
tara:strand:+ start:283 stop:564 length:282 start_codon:yes stop_codon:yes gene_type:complete